MTTLSFLLQLSQCNLTGTKSGNGGQFKREIIVKKIGLDFEIEHDAFLPNIKSESIEIENNIF